MMKNQQEEEATATTNYETAPTPPAAAAAAAAALRAPAHLIARVFSQLDCVDLLSCSLVCKQWYQDSAELREGWKNEYTEAYDFLWTVD